MCDRFVVQYQTGLEAVMELHCILKAVDSAAIRFHLSDCGVITAICGCIRFIVMSSLSVSYIIMREEKALEQVWHSLKIAFRGISPGILSQSLRMA